MARCLVVDNAIALLSHERCGGDGGIDNDGVTREEHTNTSSEIMCGSWRAKKDRISSSIPQRIGALRDAVREKTVQGATTYTKH